MKSLVTILGIILIILGLGTFSYRYFTYSTNENVAEIGNVQITAKTEKAIVIPPAVSGISIAVGIILVIIGTRRKA